MILHFQRIRQRFYHCLSVEGKNEVSLNSYYVFHIFLVISLCYEVHFAFFIQAFHTVSIPLFFPGSVCSCERVFTHKDKILFVLLKNCITGIGLIIIAFIYGPFLLFF